MEQDPLEESRKYSRNRDPHSSPYTFTECLSELLGPQNFFARVTYKPTLS
ncbi:hypothetical protein N9Z46_08405 [Akkermansiaceae bacterium]|nr:hypothetical protein [Akkermansiaceae bacterium]